MARATESLRRKIKSTEGLHSLVKTMQVIAAVNIRQYEQAVKSLVDYSRTVELGLQIALREKPVETAMVGAAPGVRLGAIIVGSDTGMVGSFNQVIAAHAISGMKSLRARREDRTVIAVGTRVADLLEQAGQEIEETFPTTGGIAGITPLVQELEMRIEQWREERGVGRVFLFYNQPDTPPTYHPLTLQMWSIDLSWLQSLKQREWPTRVLPIFTMDFDQLFAALIREYFFVSLYRALVESLASENASRLSSMQIAEKNIERRLEALNTEYQRARQSSITEELLDIVTGFEALKPYTESSNQ